MSLTKQNYKEYQFYKQEHMFSQVHLCISHHCLLSIDEHHCDISARTTLAKALGIYITTLCL